MKKITIISAVLIPVILAGGFLAYHNLPTKRHVRHMAKARLYLKENNSTAAQLEYEKAYNAVGSFTPYVSWEVLSFTNAVNLRDKKPAAALENTREFIKRNPGHAEGLVTLAQLSFQAGESDAAFEAINELLKNDPHSFPARLLLTRVRTQQGRLDLAEEQLRVLYDRHPDSLGTLLPMAEILLMQGRTQDSREFLRRAIADHPKNGRARGLLLDGYLLEGRTDSAKWVLDGWTEADPEMAMAIQVRKARILTLSDSAERAKAVLAPYLEPKEANLPAYAELAILHAKAGAYDSALKVYQQIADISPGARQVSDPFTVFLSFKNQNPAKALELLKRRQVGDRGGVNLSLILAAYVALGQENKIEAALAEQPDSVRPVLQAFLAQLPRDREFIGQWALVNYFSANRMESLALAEARKLHERWPKSDMARLLYASKLSGARRVADAAKVLEGMGQPGTTHRLTLLQHYARAGSRDKADALGRKLLAENPRMPGINLMLADLAWSTGDKQRGTEAYQAELGINPDNPLALNNLAWEFGIVQKDLAKAKPYLDKLEKHKRLDPRIMDTIGWILAANGEAAKAEPYLRAALNLVPDHPVFLYHLAYVLDKQGKKAEARPLLDAALKSKRPFDERKDAEALQAGQG